MPGSMCVRRSDRAISRGPRVVVTAEEQEEFHHSHPSPSRLRARDLVARNCRMRVRRPGIDRGGCCLECIILHRRSIQDGVTGNDGVSGTDGVCVDVGSVGHDRCIVHRLLAND